MSDKKCTYCNEKGWHQSYEGGDWHTSSCHKCNPRSPWYKKEDKSAEETSAARAMSVQ